MVSDGGELKFDTVITGGTVVLPTGAIPATIGIRGGKIAGIFNPDIRLNADENVSAIGSTIFPGLVDPHVHLWEPGHLNYREDYQHGSAAAAAGGVTTMIEMPLSIPPVKDSESFELKKGIALQKSVVDFALWGALIPASLKHLEEMHELGCVAFKAFMSYANDEYPHTPDHYLLEAMKMVANFDGLIGVHAENADVVAYASEKLEEAGVMEPEAYSEGRPPIAELDAMQRAILFAKHAESRLHIVHMSVAEGGEMVKEAKEKGVRVSNETCPHYLVFDKSELNKRGAFAKCNPPLRSRENVEQLWEQLIKGNIDCIGSDHGPYTDEEKLQFDNIWKAPPGFGGLELILPIMISEGFHKRGMSLETIANLTSTNAAAIFRLAPQKGVIQIGTEADFAIVDLNAEWTYHGKQSLSKTKTENSIYEGMNLKGKVVSTMVRGKTVFHDGKVVSPAGFGQFVRYI